MKTHLKTIVAVIVLFGLLIFLCYAINNTPLTLLIILLCVGIVVIFAIIYNIIKNNE
jgi:hypothetical protein